SMAASAIASCSAASNASITGRLRFPAMSGLLWMWKGRFGDVSRGRRSYSSSAARAGAALAHDLAVGLVQFVPPVALDLARNGRQLLGADTGLHVLVDQELQRALAQLLNWVALHRGLRSVVDADGPGPSAQLDPSPFGVDQARPCVCGSECPGP